MKLLLAGAIFLFSGSAAAWNCEHEKSIERTLDLADARELGLVTGAVDLEISGNRKLSQAIVTGRVCVSQEDWLQQSGIEFYDDGRHEVRAVLPELEDDWSIAGQRYAYLDLELEVPAHLPLVVIDGAGDIEIDSVMGVTLSDSAGDLLIEDTVGPVVIRDSSGDIELEDIFGDVIIESDASGDIRGDDIAGSVRVAEDSSGEIHFTDVGEDFIVERDTVGDISANGVIGDFRVLEDGSGKISAKDIGGELQIPDNKS
jgi:hypothetical protein